MTRIGFITSTIRTPGGAVANGIFTFAKEGSAMPGSTAVASMTSAGTCQVKYFREIN